MVAVDGDVVEAGAKVMGDGVGAGVVPVAAEVFAELQDGLFDVRCDLVRA